MERREGGKEEEKKGGSKRGWSPRRIKVPQLPGKAVMLQKRPTRGHAFTLASL